MTEPSEPPRPALSEGRVSDPETAGKELSETENAMLVLEQRWWKYAGAKEARVRVEFDMSITRYYQVLNVLLDKPEALAAHPATVARPRRLRDARRDQRSADRLPGGD